MRRIFVGLEEGDGETAYKCAGKARITWHLKELFQEREGGYLHRREHAQPFLLLPPEQREPAVKLFLCDKEAFADPFHGSGAQEILRQNAEDEEKAIGGIRDDEIRKDGMGMAAGTNKAQNTETVADRFATYEINQGTVIVGMDRAGAFHPTARTSLQFRPETSHESIKKNL